MGATFMGLRRSNGKVGTRNFIALCSTVNCSATVVRHVADRVSSSGMLAAYPHIDGVIALSHGTGCGMDSKGEGFEALERVLWGHATHPNVTAAIFIGLGCEVMQIGRLKEKYGCAYEPLVDPSEIIQLPSTVAQGDRQIPRELLAHMNDQQRHLTPAPGSN